MNVSLRVCSRPQRTRLFSSELTTKRKFQHILDPTLSSACIFLQPWGSGPSIVFQSKSGESKLLTVDFRSPVLQPSVPWSRRKCEFDIWVRYSEMLRNRERLRLVAKKWKAIVETYPWRRLDLERLDGPPPEHHSGDVLWAVYPFGGGYQLGDRFEDLVQSASTIVVLTLTWRAESSLTKLYYLFAHASSFKRLQKLIVDFTFSDRTSNDLATHTFFSHINAFSSTMITLSLNVHLYEPTRITPSSSTH